MGKDEEGAWVCCKRTREGEEGMPSAGWFKGGPCLAVAEATRESKRV